MPVDEHIDAEMTKDILRDPSTTTITRDEISASNAWQPFQCITFNIRRGIPDKGTSMPLWI